MDTISAIHASNHAAYGRIAALWNETVDGHYDFAAHERCREVFTRHLPGRRILEVGCGLGWDSGFFSRAGYDVTATDFQEAFVALTKLRNPDVTALVMDMTRPLPFSEPFHGIYGFASFLHVPREQSEETLRRFAALLMEDGILFLRHARSDKGHGRYTQPNLLIDDNPVSCFCHSEREMEVMLLNAGFSSVQFTGDSPENPGCLAGELGLVPYQVLARK